ncbi:hypothetical protein Ddye_016390 [Dipteronia dyeriana]|uniref:MULE transposase domain-containing protein n=1 Tax=Dipteronia dyeriana TaxID=168575 RepID=A0AAD9WZI8_9ROSI|nr:hypothetical protein Ddye_016390 [Dipteronia dyeriana]
MGSSALKSNRGTYWHVKEFVNEHTCERNDNYNIEFKRVSAAVIGDLFVSKYRDLGHIIHPKDIVYEKKEQHGIHISYNKVYSTKEHALNQVFGGPWESFQRFVDLIFEETPKIYPISRLCDVSFGSVQTSIFNVMEVIFPDATHGICAYHLTQNLKRFCKQRDVVILLYYHATYAYRIEDFDRLMVELKETHRKPRIILLDLGTGLLGLGDSFPDLSLGES